MVIYYLFSDYPTIADKEKYETARKLLNVSRPEVYCTGLPVSIKPLNLKRILTDVLCPESWFLFYALDVSYDWFIKPPSLLPNFESLQKAKHYINTIKAVNDEGKRNVKLLPDYSAI